MFPSHDNIGSLVSDFHRNMIKGGIYIYPSTSQSPKGKLRLLYECNPMALLAEQAGGKAMIVYTTGNGVNGFTLDPSIGTYYLSHPNMKFPTTGKIYSINEGNYIKFPQGVKDYIKYCQLEEGDRPYTSRYIGSLVSDFHRNMIKGGIYIYPSTSQSPKGKLRLLYECNPMALLAEQAGGKASDGYRRILEIEPTELHQRVPFFCGSAAMVTKAEEFMAKALKP